MAAVEQQHRLGERFVRPIKAILEQGCGSQAS
jgi:hypothetical protein